MNNAIVTGGAGFIGHHLVMEMVKNNYRVSIIDDLTNRNNFFISQLKSDRDLSNNIFVHKVDIRNRAALFNVFKRGEIDACVHLAAKTSVQDSVQRPSETIDVNVKGTLNVLQACANYNVQNFIFASSAAVYGHSKNLPASEEISPDPISVYGASKVAGEALVSAFESRIKNRLCLRFFNVYGEGQNPTYSGVIAKFIERLSARLPPIIYGDGHHTRDFISVKDTVRAIISAIERNIDTENHWTSTHTINVGTGHPSSISDLAYMMIDIIKADTIVKPVYSDPVSADIVHSYADVNRAKKLLQFTAAEDLRTGIENLVKRTNRN